MALSYHVQWLLTHPLTDSSRFASPVLLCMCVWSGFFAECRSAGQLVHQLLFCDSPPLPDILAPRRMPLAKPKSGHPSFMSGSERGRRGVAEGAATLSRTRTHLAAACPRFQLHPCISYVDIPSCLARRPHPPSPVFGKLVAG